MRFIFRYKFFLFSFLNLLCIVISLQAQSLSYTSYTIKDGLPSNTITAIFQDSKGYLWVGTNNGLCRYDGNEFKIFSTLNGLSNNWITCIAESPVEKGTMWIGTIAGGINKFKNGILKSFKYGEEIEWNNISDFCIDKNGIVWIASASGFLKIINDSVKIIADKNSPKHPSELLTDENGNVWCSEKNQVYICNNKSLWKKLNIQLADNTNILSMVKDFENRIWAGTSDNYILELNEEGIIQKEKTIYGIPYQIMDKGESSFLIRDRNTFFSESKKNLVNQQIISMPEDENMPGDVTSPFFIDREGNIWIGTWTKGLLKVSDLSLYHFQFPDEVKPNWANFDNDGNIWAGATGGVWEIYLDHINQWQKKFHPLNHGKNTKIFVSSVDSQNNLWLHLFPGEKDTLVKLNTYAYKIINIKNTTSNLVDSKNLTNLIRFINSNTIFLFYYVDRQGRLWMSTGTGVYVADVETGKIIRAYKVKDGIPGNSIRTIYQDHKNQIWMGGWDDGVSIFSPNENQDSLPVFKKRITKKNGLPDNMIRSIYEDKSGNIWIGTRHNGVYILKGSSLEPLKSITMKDGLLSNTIWEIIEGPDNRMWLNTDIGIMEIDLNTLSVLPPKKEFLISFNRLLSIRSYKNKFWVFCSDKELFIYEDVKKTVEKIPPLIDITKILINGNNFPADKLKDLSYAENNITIEFAGLSFKEEQAVRYQYRLIGADTNWTKASTHHYISFAALKPGEYNFQVRAINGDGVVSELPATLSFTIIPPFWLRWWFIVLLISILSILLFLLHRYRIKQLLKMESLRVRISSDLHDEIGSSIGSIVLRSRMLQKEENWNTKSKEELGRIQNTAIQTSEVLRDIVWFVNPGFDKLDDMILRMKDTAQSLLAGIPYEFISPEEIISVKLTLEFRRNLFLSYKEILHNIAKHSNANDVRIEVAISSGYFFLTVTDNGIGFVFHNNKVSGNGLISIKKRMEAMNGKMEINSAKNKGTVVKLSAKTT